MFAILPGVRWNLKSCFDFVFPKLLETVNILWRFSLAIFNLENSLFRPQADFLKGVVFLFSPFPFKLYILCIYYAEYIVIFCQMNIWQMFSPILWTSSSAGWSFRYMFRSFPMCWPQFLKKRNSIQSFPTPVSCREYCLSSNCEVLPLGLLIHLELVFCARW